MLKKIFIWPIRFYQKHISPHKAPCCRFTPTCSHYAIDAITEWGVIAGLSMATWRILRCNPFGKGGEDPVPINRRRRARLARRAAKKEAKRAEKAKRPTENAGQVPEEPQTPTEDKQDLNR